MPRRDHPRSNRAGRSGDDLRKIAGIGPAVAQRLTDAGIDTYEEMAKRTTEEIAAVLVHMAGISPGRIADQDWIGQARVLADPPSEPPLPRQRYAAFHVEFLLESDNSVRRTRVHHHQTDADDAWPGWDQERLLAFMRERMPLTGAARPGDAVDSEPPHIESPGQVPVRVPSIPAGQQPPPATFEGLPASFLAIEELTPIREGQRGYIRRPDEPSLVRLTIRTNPIDKPIPDAFDFSATIAARRLGGHDRLPAGSIHGTIRIGEPLSVEVAGPPLPIGLYRLVVNVALYPADHSPGEASIHTQGASGDIMQVANAPGESASAVA